MNHKKELLRSLWVYETWMLLVRLLGRLPREFEGLQFRICTFVAFSLRYTHILHSSSFLGLPCRILNINH